MARDNAALGKQIFNVSKAHGKPAIGPDSVCNDFGRKTVALEGAGLFGFGHPAQYDFTSVPAS